MTPTALNTAVLGLTLPPQALDALVIVAAVLQGRYGFGEVDTEAIDVGELTGDDRASAVGSTILGKIADTLPPLVASDLYAMADALAERYDCVAV